VIHRDLKPANVWLTADGTAKLGDFGLAITTARSRVTVEGMIVGTVAYMAPEQALGKGTDARSDLYALGALLYELVTGRSPFIGTDPVAVASQHLHTRPVAPSWHNPAVPHALDTLILQLLQKDPGKRPASAAEVGEQLAVLGSQSSGERTPAPKNAAHWGWVTGPSSRANPLDGLDAGVFVAREKELAQLRALVEEALAGRGRVLLVAGEAGIGKTRLVQELGTYAQLRGMQVLWGRCHPGGGAPAYWPWAQMLRSYVPTRTPEELLGEMGAGAADIAQVISVVRERLPEIPPPPPLEPDHQRFRLFDSFTSFFRTAATCRPLMLVLDDLHWADAASLLLLQFLAREIAGSHLLIAGSYREEEVQHGRPLSQTLAELARVPSMQRIALSGLCEADVAEFIARTSGRQPSAALAAPIWRQTDGNPFFVGEVVRWLVTQGQLENVGTGVGVPPSVRDVIGQRLARLSGECHRLLMLAAVIGRDFDVRLLQQLAAAPVDVSTVTDPLNEAVAARVAEEVAEAPGRYRFVHALIREVLYTALPAIRRQQLHEQIGIALEILHTKRIEPHLGELAYHFGEAATLGNTSKAIAYARRAAERALMQFAHEDAATYYEHALHLFDLQGDADEHERGEMLLALALARFHAGQLVESQAAFLQAGDVVRRVGDSDLFARVALGEEGGRPMAGQLEDKVFGPLLEEASIALGSDDSPLRARVLAQLAMWLLRPEARQRAKTMSRESVAIARRLGDPNTLARALQSASVVLYEPTNLEERLSLTAESVSLTERIGDHFLTANARLLRVWPLLELGDIPSLDKEIEACIRLAEEFRDPMKLVQVGTLCAMRAELVGRFDEAEAHARRTLALAQRIQGGPYQATLQTYAALMFDLRRQQGRMSEVETSVAAFAEQSAVPAWRAALAFVYSEQGRSEEARGEIDRLALREFTDLPIDWLWLTTLSLLVDVPETRQDARRVGLLYHLLQPYARQCVVVGDAAICLGSVSRSLGVLAGAMQRWERACRHFEDALAIHTRMGARPWLAHTQYNYATILLQRREAGDHARALALLNAAIDTTQELGMKALLERAVALKLNAQGVASVDTKTSIDIVATAVEHERPDLRSHAAPDGTVTILFSDIDACAAVSARLGAPQAHAMLRAHNRIMREQLSRHGGFEVKSQDDGFLVAFQSARRALLCAIAVQRTFAGYAAEHPEEPIRVRIGLHVGETTGQHEDFFGTTLHVAASIAAAARGGEILISSVLRELTASVVDRHIGAGRTVELPGFREVRTVFPVSWTGEVGTEPERAAASCAALLRNEGDYWSLAYNGTTARLKTSKGLQYLARLLRHPAEEFHALELMREHGSPPGNQGLPILDAQAKAAYRRRLGELREEVAEAERNNDLGRAAGLGVEIEMLAEQLATAVGLGGRDRTQRSASERARSTVTQRIRNAIERIAERSPALAAHLSACIKTGTFCVYRPDPTRRITWQL
jgi:class 3 adenylate cyclase